MKKSVFAFGFSFALIGYFFNRYYPSIQPDLLKTACVLIGVVWGFVIHIYNKLFDLTTLSCITSTQHNRLEELIHKRLKFFWAKVFLIGCLVLIAMLPSIAKEADGEACVTDCVFNSKQVYCAYYALGIAFFILMRLLGEQEEIRHVSSSIKQQEREEIERKERLSELM